MVKKGVVSDSNLPCLICGADVPIENAFCGQCGTPFRPLPITGAPVASPRTQPAPEFISDLQWLFKCVVVALLIWGAIVAVGALFGSPATQRRLHGSLGLQPGCHSRSSL